MTTDEHATPPTSVDGPAPAQVSELLDLAPCALMEVRLHPGGREEITYFNRAACEQYGYTAQEAVGQSPDILRASDSDEVQRRRDRLHRHGTWHGRTMHRAKDGRLLQVELRVTSWTDVAGNFERYLCAMTDTTEETEHTRCLAEQSALLELAPDPILARDPDRRITYWNRTAETIYGYTPRRPLAAPSASS